MAVWQWMATAVLVGSLAACDESFTGPSVPIDDTFTMAPGDIVHVDGTSTYLEFGGVGGDSRCPVDVNCFTAGDAVVRLNAGDDGARRRYELHTGKGQPVQHDGLTITLVELTPARVSGRTIAPADYRVSLRVTR